MWIFVVDGVFLKYAISQGTEIFANRIITAGNHPIAGGFFLLFFAILLVIPKSNIFLLFLITIIFVNKAYQIP